MSFKLSRRASILLGLLSVFIIFIGYVAYIETHNDVLPTPTSSPAPTEKPTNSSSTPLVTDYSITIPEIYHVGFGIAEINLKFIAPSPLQNIQTQANFSTTILPITLSTNLNNTTNSILPAIVNGTTINIKVEVYLYTMSTDNPREFVASQEWNETKFAYA
jgi:hypothetical protein